MVPLLELSKLTANLDLAAGQGSLDRIGGVSWSLDTPRYGWGFGFGRGALGTGPGVRFLLTFLFLANPMALRVPVVVVALVPVMQQRSPGS